MRIAKLLALMPPKTSTVMKRRHSTTAMQSLRMEALRSWASPEALLRSEKPQGASPQALLARLVVLSSTDLPGLTSMMWQCWGLEDAILKKKKKGMRQEQEQEQEKQLYNLKKNKSDMDGTTGHVTGGGSTSTNTY